MFNQGRRRPSVTTTINFFVALTFIFLLYITSQNLGEMWTRTNNNKNSKLQVLSMMGSTASLATAVAGAVDTGWYAPAQTEINNLEAVMSGTGVYGFIYNSSTTSDDKYGIYNWCNMPHVRKTEYSVPDPEFQLQYVEVIHRHHKRTPYASNAFPIEPYHWDCDDQALYKYGAPLASSGSSHIDSSAKVFWKGYTSDINPFVPSGWIGNCSFPQITTTGLDDSWTHGNDLYEVYHDVLNFLPSRETEEEWRDMVAFRVTQNQITSQVAGMLISGFWNTTTKIPLLIQAPNIDSLEPQYPCPSSSGAFNEIKSRSSKEWQDHLDAAESLYKALDDISGVPRDDSGFHASMDHYYDNLSARQCHSKPLPCCINDSSRTRTTTTTGCVDQNMADAVYRIGNWEYSRIYRDDQRSLDASVGGMGVWFAELATHLRQTIVQGSADGVKYFHNVAHDGSMSRVLSVLQIDEMVWPGMGAEVVFEVWEKGGSVSKRDGKSEELGDGYYLRVLFGGKTLKSSNPSLGTMDMLPLDRFLEYVDGLVGKDASLIKEKCEESS